jgi:crotonobetaine/carnitine-CoA ligase
VVARIGRGPTRFEKTRVTPLEVLSLYPEHDYTLKRAFDTRARRDPSRPFLVFRDRTWSWGAFDAAIERAARMLIRHGIRKGDRVAIMSQNSDAHVLLLFALARIGGIVVPVNPEFGEDEAAYVLGHAGVRGVVASTATIDVVRGATSDIAPAPWLALVDGAQPDAPSFFELIERGEPAGDAPPADVTADDTFAIVYTSGTTGFPKGVMHSQRNFVLAGERHVARVHLQPDDRTLCILPMFHVNALFNMLASTLAAGSCLVVAERFSASSFWRLAADTGATQVNVMAAVSSILARRPRSEFVPTHRLRVANGSGFTQETLDVFRREFGIPIIIEGLGMTEIPGAFSNPFEGPHKLGCMGKPGVHPDPSVRWTQARILDDDGGDVSEGAVGELAVRIPTLMQGYYRDPEQTAASFRDGWFMTGDLVRRDEDGYFHFVARRKDIIRRRGENIAGAELDRVIGEHPEVAEAAAIPVPADVGEEEVLAVVVPRAGARIEPRDIRAWCAGRLAAHKVPRFVVFVEALPHTPTHKVAKHVLRDDRTLRERAVDFDSQSGG